MKKVISIILIFCVLSAVSVSFAYAQSADQLQLGLSRDFGYGGFGNDIQGLFSAKIKNPPSDLTRVVFFIDATSMGEDSTPPFSLQFNTDSYPLGDHSLSAVGYTSDGKQIDSNKIQVLFVPASAGTQTVFKIIVPVIGLILLMALLAIFIPLVLNRGKISSVPLGAPRKYGIGGGAICPKCGRPFPLRLWWINIGLSKIDRCPYCGKWSLVRPRSLADLREAEAAELSQPGSGQTVAGETEADKLKKELDDSRFQNT
jgi:DNA-directed RNA polymerase subunit RPC12/RpoP